MGFQTPSDTLTTWPTRSVPLTRGRTTSDSGGGGGGGGGGVVTGAATTGAVGLDHAETGLPSRDGGGRVDPDGLADVGRGGHVGGAGRVIARHGAAPTTHR